MPSNPTVKPLSSVALNKSGAPKEKTAWQLHLKEYRSKNPQSSLKQCMQEASKSYSRPNKD